MRRGNVFLLPSPPALSGDYQNDSNLLREHLNAWHTIMNQAIQSFQGRINTVQQVNAQKPPNVTGFTVDGKQGLFSLVWNRIKNSDGYVILQASDSAMVNIIGRYHVDDGSQCSHQIVVGNVAVTSYFQIYAYQGPQYGEPSPIVASTTVVYGSVEASPTLPPIAPLPPKTYPVRSGPNLP